MKRNLLFVIALFICSYSFGQEEVEAYRFSANDLSGSARGQAMGGAFGALGGDITGVAINPAGIGIYRRSEIVANMAVTSNNVKTDSKTDWIGNPISQSKLKFNFDNLSYIGYHPLNGGIRLNYGFNYNRIKNFDRKYTASGSNMSSSLTDYLAYFTNGIQHSFWDNSGDRYLSNEPWLSILAWDGYLINKKDGTNNGYVSLLDDGEKVSPKLNVSEKGYIESYDFMLGSNISDRFFWGVTFALTDLNYSLSSDYGEEFQGGGNFVLDNFLETKGSGYQFKAGIIYRPTDILRLGVSYHSPTWYSMTNYYHARVTPGGILGDDDKLAGPTETPNESSYTNYYFRTPYTWTFSAAAVLGTKALLSLDYEIKDYTAMNLQDQDRYDYEKDNQCIDEHFRKASTIRAGFEYLFTPQFSGRAGFALMQNPYEAAVKSGDTEVWVKGMVPHYTINGDATYLTTGLGYRFMPIEDMGGYFYIDAAFVYRQQTNDLYFYSPVVDNANSKPIVNSYPGSYKEKSYKGLVTVGYKF
jgi:long-subunit fatty acid transport protein